MVNRKQPARLNGAGRYAHIVGWGMAMPKTIMTNDDLSAIVETNDEWISSRTGIRERRIASEQESTATLAYQAARNALEVADILPVDLNLIIVATSTPEHIFPSTASLVQGWMGANRAGAFDLSAACSGFVYGLDMATQAIRSGSIETALVIGAETMSRILDWQDRSTCILFGDGAGAVVLQAGSNEGGLLSSVLRSDGAGCDLLSLPSVGSIDLNRDSRVQTTSTGKLFMVGSEVFKFATRVVDESIREAVELADLTLDDIDLVVPHQANLRILQSASKKLGIDRDKFFSNLEKYGNTSAASIPIALCEAIESGRVHQNDHLVMVGFGAGLAWASAVIKWAVPHPRDQQSSAINRQRRRAFYTFARWRSRLGRWRRAITSAFTTMHPERGRMFRLRRRIEQSDLD